MADQHDDHHDDQHGEGHHGHGSRFIQHHYDDGQHQFDSGKLAVWFFLAQEVLFFSALFVAYVLYRHHRPEIFAYAHSYLDVKWGAINTAVLIISSLSAAWAVRCAQLAQRRGLILCLGITIVCALGFLGIKYVEYMHKIHEGILFGNKFDPCISSGGAHLLTKKDHCPGFRRSECQPANIDQQPDVPGWQVACTADEVKVRYEAYTENVSEEVVGKDGKVTTVTKPMRKEREIELGRKPLQVCEMEAHHGGPPHATNAPCWEIAQNPHVCPGEQIAALVHFGDHKERDRTTKIDLKCEPAVIAPPTTDPHVDAPVEPKLGEPTFGPSQRPSAHDEKVARSMGPPPEHTNMFFSIYFAMTGLHGIHVLAGIIVYIWLLIRAIKGHFTPEYFGPVDYAALYWHLVDLIWIFLFPLLYLIH